MWSDLEVVLVLLLSHNIKIELGMEFGVFIFMIFKLV